MQDGVLVGMTPRSPAKNIKRLLTVGAFIVAFAAAAPPAGAAISSASIDGSVATLNLDGANDVETVSVSGGLLAHTGVGGGLQSTLDWDSGEKEVTLPADGTVHVVVNGGGGNDTLVVLGGRIGVADATLNGDAGDDFLAGSETDDTLSGGDGNDMLVGRPGVDVMSGGPGDDTFEWNNGDSSDRLNGDAGVDTVEVNGSADFGDAFVLDPVPGGVRFRRTNLVPFQIDAAVERFHVNADAGNDLFSASPGLALTQLTVDAGDGDDQVDIRDNAAEIASGGSGTDSVTADSADLDVLDGFESVDRPPVIAPPPVSDPPPAVQPPPAVAPPPAAEPPPAFLAPPNVALPRPVTIRSTSATARNGRVSIKVSCPASSPGNCVGTLVLRTAKQVRVGRHKLALTLGRTSYNVRRGAIATLKVRLSKESKRLADRRGRLEVLARTSTAVSGAAAQSSRRLTLTLGRIDQGRQR
jgi:hypothetical protein